MSLNVPPNEVSPAKRLMCRHGNLAGERDNGAVLQDLAQAITSPSALSLNWNSLVQVPSSPSINRLSTLVVI